MRGRVGVIFQGRGFEPTGCILQFHFQRKRGSVESQNFPSGFMKAAVTEFPLTTSDPEVGGSIPNGDAFKSFGFSYLLFAFRREIAHLT